jgi:hypothetical protein
LSKKIKFLLGSLVVLVAWLLWALWKTTVLTPDEIIDNAYTGTNKNSRFGNLLSELGF